MASFLAAATLVALLPASFAQTPLASQHFEYTALPYQADPNDGDRGHQFGYNICNSTTETQESLCQTAMINSIDDFCLWGPPEPDSLIGNVEGESVAWCTKPGHGTRLIPAGALTGVQFIKTPDYVQVTGLITQNLVNIATDDSGGELDPHGADERGNPLGGLLFSNAYNGQIQQAVEWHNFMGGGAFCLKACDPAGANAARYCQHIYDRIGCLYNAPAAYEDKVFLSCAGDNQDFPGIYTGADGAVSTYQQPDEALGPIQALPYDPKIPATSQCTTYESASLYAGAPAPTGTVSRASGTGTRTAAGTGTRSAATGSKTATTSSTSGDRRGAQVAGPLGVALVSFLTVLFL